MAFTMPTLLSLSYLTSVPSGWHVDNLVLSGRCSAVPSGLDAVRIELGFAGDTL